MMSYLTHSQGGCGLPLEVFEHTETLTDNCFKKTKGWRTETINVLSCHMRHQNDFTIVLHTLQV